MDEKTKHSLQRNVWIYGLMKIFTKRVFLPLTAIYLVSIGGLSLAQIAFLATLSPAIGLLSEVPTGYFADRLSRKSSLYMSAGFLTLMSLVLAVAPSFHWAVVATVFEAVGYAFLTGAAEALMHDTLVLQGREKDYSKVVARAQSIGLLGNMVLVAAIGYSYKLNPHLPFYAAVIAYMLLFLLASMLYEPQRMRQIAHANPVLDLGHNLKVFINRHTFFLFLTIGVLGAGMIAFADFDNLTLQQLGIAPSLLGVFVSISSLIAFLLSLVVHYVKKLNLFTYMALDTAILVGYMLGIGLSKNLYIAMAAVIISLVSFRLRNVIYQHHLLEMYPENTNKATLLSVMSFFSRINQVWMPALFGSLVVSRGYFGAYTIMGFGLLVILLICGYMAKRMLMRPVAAG